MRTFITVLGYFLVISQITAGHDSNKDGFNYYKDYLRGKSDDLLEPEPAGVGERMLYFYRTPLQLYPGLSASALEQEYRKRTGNEYKNRMLSKDLMTGEGVVEKRTSKAALSLILAHLRNQYAK
ncbi:hypothetical protein EVAR_6704_1 [Eumeta japonica]|uniref:Uncharacterized protein n=1 Tax=Eumeta variegata TaxID=151549 RepID=A0A4C1TKN7_EUMVA|nr:hypothetical protein EVAR_6704_1 [Eumeta japonica]